jgi:hypothetical protein
VLAFLLFLVALAFYLYSKHAPTEEEKITCVLRISEVDREMWETEGERLIRVGDSLRCQNGTVVMGTVETVSVIPHRYAAVRGEEPSWEDHPYLVDLEVTVEMRARSKEGDGLRVGDLRIAAGSTGEYRFGNYLARAELLEVKIEK